jgi:hypothetical protein
VHDEIDSGITVFGIDPVDYPIALHEEYINQVGHSRAIAVYLRLNECLTPIAGIPVNEQEGPHGKLTPIVGEGNRGSQHAVFLSNKIE